MRNGIKVLELGNGEFLYFWYANNAGRGSDNCTIIRSNSPERARVSKMQTGVLATIRTSAYMGKVNFSARVRSELGL